MRDLNNWGNTTFGPRDPRSEKGKQSGARNKGKRDGSNAEKDRAIQCRAIGRSAHGTRQRNYANPGMPNGRMRKCRDKRTKDRRHQKTDKNVGCKPMLIYGT
jgi:hypothetical protein